MIELLNDIDWTDIGQATIETLIMTGVSLSFTILLGLPLGVLLFLTGRRQLLEQPQVYALLSFVVNLLRSVPFLILLIVMIPVTLVLMGTSLGIEGTIPPLVAGATPFYARLVENTLREVDRGIIEACQAMGARTWQIVLQALLPEALPGLIAGATVTTIALVSYAAMSGVIGGGGLGDLALRFGYQRFRTDVMFITVAILVALVQLLQLLGDRMVLRFTRK
ncbi:methionine ABC transporter permease [Noviherbaspirillum malthae]|uniref:methionine ABC transporter permease n=1 Tax=Noviherbaspirillum malthae TaxID=1260987 RepID=UPI00188F6FCC|nr:methionine ABC transporter permease [Noviherbaspirillum malthae]